MEWNLTCCNKHPTGKVHGLTRCPSQVNVSHLKSLSHTMQTQDSEKLVAISPNVSVCKEVSECLSSWFNYLQMLNGLCSAGSRLSEALGGMVRDTNSPSYAIAVQCHSAWEELVKATAAATSAVKSQVTTTLQDVNNQDSTESSQVVCGSLMTFVKLQQQFCASCSEFLSSVPTCSCSSSHDPDCGIGVLQQSLARMYAPVPPWPHRRWSEAAATDLGGEGDAIAPRRWSVPCPPQRGAAKLGVPSQDRSRSATPDSVWRSSLASQDELQEVIQLLSVQPQQATQLHHPSMHMPGVTLTNCSGDGNLPESGTGWGEGHSEERRASAPLRNNSGSPQPSQSTHRASWHAPDPHSCTWGEHELFPPTLDPANFASRKSSSSTDSSSSHSLHSRSTTGSEGGAEVRAHLYSMWSGGDMAFMRVPESAELPDGPSHTDKT
ncbi:uncharacterized protein LOC126187940 isoform X1 [Schistocerca cancellata]|uniref:uncharacterized protein LOC126187940 isoform X1 n=1 Tax=Schistocerca cancellata TaxID=274614 RepID=UPI0021185367|nr:uncharacterized protein LOC126187940 isoform X1 [Schistocerca cancellata]XP_049785264.1 uncharacterized protein LOC126187940 isoform X1 [Schistocerca cancellata]